MKVTAIKIVLIGIWVLSIIPFAAPDMAIYPDIFKIVGLVLIVAHAAELILFRKLHNSIGDCINTLLFGVLNIQYMKKRT